MQTREIPWHHIDNFSWGAIDCYVDRFTSWLYRMKRKGVRIVFFPSPSDIEGQFTIALASASIHECADKIGMSVSTEKRLRKKSLPKQTSGVQSKTSSFHFPNPFEQIVITEPGIAEFIPFKMA